MPPTVEADDARHAARPTGRRGSRPELRRAARIAYAASVRSCCLDRFEPGRFDVADRGPEPRPPSAIGEVPASNFAGSSAQVVSGRRSPCGSCGRPAGTAPSRSGAPVRPAEEADATRPAQLVVETATKSVPSACTSTRHMRRRLRGIADVDRATVVRPRPRARRRLIVPSEFETKVRSDHLDVAEAVEVVELQLAVGIDAESPGSRRPRASRSPARGRSSSGAPARSQARRRPARDSRAPMSRPTRLSAPGGRFGRR